ncbi:radical SAM-associated putative lipoprotein [uncultured Parabacteroides sp.]|jgi:putative lipoprotein (rSAM/lipoprotein system)|uniref:radical SAM-associated putative lipoprotein n=1 Tax=uncultured Parabacteroides sp. TaxID=512312 RepID=UPI0025D155A6|nr:radical SAM-associated putative lipoprotein [uncultured Parabacteroides sp.]
MKNPNHKLLKAVNWLLAGILAVLGFPGCNNDDGNEEADMYGSPHASYHLMGRVQNAAQEGIPDIKLETQISFGTEFMPLQDPIITNKDGYFQSSSDGPTAQTLRIIATDIDGDINGSYANDTIDISLSKDDYEGNDGSWFKGHVDKHDLNIELKEKKDNE